MKIKELWNKSRKGVKAGMAAVTESNVLTVSYTHLDVYKRQAYGRRTNKYPRRCGFFGTSNEEEFLKDMTGNRRFWPVDVGVHPEKKSVWQDLPQEVDQIWAEAYTYWILGEPLYMTKEEEQLSLIHISNADKL